MTKFIQLSNKEASIASQALFPMNRTFLIIVVLTILPLPVWAQTSINFDVKGAGGSSCGTWTQDHAQEDVSTSASMEDEWVLGFIVGQELLYADSTHKNYTISTDLDGIIGWINNYCQQNPVKEIVDAAQDFVAQSNTVSPSDH